MLARPWLMLRPGSQLWSKSSFGPDALKHQASAHGTKLTSRTTSSTNRSVPAPLLKVCPADGYSHVSRMARPRQRMSPFAGIVLQKSAAIRLYLLRPEPWMIWRRHLGLSGGDWRYQFCHPSEILSDRR